MLLLAALALSAYGIFAVYIAGTDENEAYAFNQAIGFVLGMVGAIPLAIIDYRVWKRYLKYIFIATLVILLAVMFFGFVAGGAQSWIYIGAYPGAAFGVCEGTDGCCARRVYCRESY